jgi:prolyl-tRNA synthetase
MAKPKNAISPTRTEDYPQWYQQVVRAAELAEPSPVRGCMVIKPWGWALWENFQRVLDSKFKSTGHRNAYFPLFIPVSYLEKEAKHVEGFAKECAVITHHRLEDDGTGKLVPAGPLEEPLVVRPTSETIIGEMFSRWIESYRDLPLLINQWANVVRWEMRTRMFLRTTEFLWQEGHTAHATIEEAQAETKMILDLYADFAENYMAMPVMTGRKTAAERFPGAVETYAIEAMMQDGKALQSGTSHFLGQNFSKASGIKFLDEHGERVHAWTTSWGVSTRLIGGLVMTHGDDDGLKIPPRLAPAQIVIMPITFKADDPEEIHNYCRKLADDLRVIPYYGKTIEVEIDDRDIRGGEKNWSWIKRGIPIRLEVGPRDMAEDSVFMGRRDLPHNQKRGVPRGELLTSITAILEEMQMNMLESARAFRDARTVTVSSEADLYDAFAEGRDTGFVLAPYHENPEVEEKVKKDLAVTVRCIDDTSDRGRCAFGGGDDAPMAVWARSY